MTGEMSRQVADKREKPSYDLDSLKRELWMRVLGMKTRTPSQTSVEPKAIAADTGASPRGTTN
jgi:hypothetical protein